MTVSLIAGSLNPARLQIPAFLLISLTFYAYSSIPHLILLSGLILASWLFGRLYFALKAKKWHQASEWVIWLGVFVNLAALLVWKYGDSMVRIWNSLDWMPAQNLGLALPLGISFYSLQQIGFLLDLRLGRAKSGSLVDYAAFITFFPQLLSGPIVTSRRMSRQFASVRAGIDWDQRVEMATRGIAWIAIGLFKKVVIADNLARYVTPLVEKATHSSVSALEALTVSLASGPLIYFDFCGYSDMAVGLGLLFGVQLPYNFNAPQRSSSHREGWRRWHITFHDFVRDHVYRPLQKRLKHRKFGTIAVIFVVFSVSAFWHGDGPRYIVWGLLTFLAFVLLNWFAKILPKHIRPFIERTGRYFMTITLPLIFISPGLAVALEITNKTFSIHELWIGLANASIRDLVKPLLLVLLTACWHTEISTQVLINEKKDHPERTFFGYRPPEWSPNIPWALFLALVLSVSCVFVGQSPTFIYYQF